jgi:hypothetical protein
VRVRLAPVLVLFLCGFQGVKTYGQVVATWTDSTGHWSNPANWSTLTVPNNSGGAFYNAVINGTGSDTVTFDSSGTVINSLSLGPGETLQDDGHSPSLTIGDPTFPAARSLTNGGTINWRNGSTLTLDITAGNGSITNSGVINLTNSRLKINDSGNGNTVVLSGGGTVNLSGAVITGAFKDATLTNSNNVIQGSGTISNLTLVNNGTINANAFGALTITPNSGGFTNNGIVNVTGFGGLVINAGAGPATNSGPMDVNNSNLTVRGAFNQIGPPDGGILTLQNGSIGTITGAMSNDGTVSINASSLTVGGDYGGSSTNVSNGGTLKVLGNFNNNVGIGPGLSLSGGSSAVINGNFLVSDNGFIVDDSALTIRGDYEGTTVNRIAFIQNGSTMAVQGNFENGGDSWLSVSGGSSVTVSGTAFNGFGTMMLGRGTLTVQGSFINDDSGWITLGNSTLTVNGTFTNGFPDEGRDISPQGCSAGGASFLCLSGPGNVASLNAVQNNSLISVDAGSSLAVRGGGFANNSGGTLILGGSLNAIGGFANNGGSVITNPGSTLSTSTYSQSAGLTDVSGTLVANSYRQSGGATIIESGGLVSATTFTATGGTVTVNGILDPTAVEIGSHGTLQGTGKIFGNVAMGGTIMPGAPGAPGTLTIFGNYEQIGNGSLEELMSPLSRSLLKVNGSVALDSNSYLDIILLNGYDPLGQKIDIMDYSSLAGQFSNGSSFWEDGYLWDVTYGQHEVDVTAVKTPEPGSLLQLSIGLAALAFYAHKKMNKTKRLA